MCKFMKCQISRAVYDSKKKTVSARRLLPSGPVKRQKRDASELEKRADLRSVGAFAVGTCPEEKGIGYGDKDSE
jgi:hypothetical protein